MGKRILGAGVDEAIRHALRLREEVLAERGAAHRRGFSAPTMPNGFWIRLSYGEPVACSDPVALAVARYRLGYERDVRRPGRRRGRAGRRAFTSPRPPASLPARSGSPSWRPAPPAIPAPAPPRPPEPTLFRRRGGATVAVSVAPGGPPTKR